MSHLYRLLLTSLTFIVLGPSTPLAHADAAVVDQSFTSPHDLGAAINECCPFVAQTYTAGRSGALDGINISVESTNGSTLPLHVAIRGVTNGSPNSTVLGETTLSSSSAPLGLYITFPQLIQQVAGVQYSIVVNYAGAPPPGPGQAQGGWSGATGNHYPGGILLSSPDGSSTWNSSGAGFDVHFRTYVRPAVFPGQMLISEFRSRGPNGPLDEFVELYNNTDSPLTPGGTGFAVVGEDEAVRCTVPAATVIPARGNFLCAGPAYSLSAYAASNAPITSDIGDAQGVALFNTTNPAGFTLANRLDAFGYTSSPPLYREGAGYPYSLTYNLNQSFYRDLISRLPKDTGDNSVDFIAVNADPHVFNYGLALGAPGPENLSSPIQRHAQFTEAPLDPAASASAMPNRERSTAVVPNGSLGTLTIRRKFTNHTTNTVTRLRFRVIDITTFNTPTSPLPGQPTPCTSPCADLRALSSPDEAVVATSGGPVSTSGLTLEEPPAQPNGGGYNSSLRVNTITLATPLASGASVNVNFRLGVMRSGGFRFFVNVEALP